MVSGISDANEYICIALAVNPMLLRMNIVITRIFADGGICPCLQQLLYNIKHNNSICSVTINNEAHIRKINSVSKSRDSSVISDKVLQFSSSF